MTAEGISHLMQVRGLKQVSRISSPACKSHLTQVRGLKPRHPKEKKETERNVYHIPPRKPLPLGMGMNRRIRRNSLQKLS